MIVVFHKEKVHPIDYCVKWDSENIVKRGYITPIESSAKLREYQKGVSDEHQVLESLAAFIHPIGIGAISQSVDKNPSTIEKLVSLAESAYS